MTAACFRDDEGSRGKRWVPAAALRALDLLNPYVTGGRRTKHAHIYLRTEVQAVLDRLAAGLPFRLCVEEDETTFTAAAHAYAVPLAVLCREALGGRLGRCGRMATGGGLQGLIVRREEVLDVRRRVRLSDDGKILADVRVKVSA